MGLDIWIHCHDCVAGKRFPSLHYVDERLQEADFSGHITLQ